jgi:hypothetical protein
MFAKVQQLILQIPLLEAQLLGYGLSQEEHLHHQPTLTQQELLTLQLVLSMWNLLQPTLGGVTLLHQATTLL